MKFVICFCLCAVFVTIGLFFTNAPERQTKTTINKIQEQLDFEPETVHNGVITFYVDERIWLKNGELDVCSVKNCLITQKKSMQNVSNALILLPNSLVPSTRSKDQIWILHLMESPVNTHSLEKWNGLINYTASYRQDSDFPTPYGIVRKSNVGILAEETRDETRNKTGQVLWVASNCFTSNGRQQIVHKLSNYINVTVFGKCGAGLITQQQLQIYMQTYKFYLAFENSNCRDYVTEKFFNCLKNGILPIVFGEKRKAYEQIAPPNSFIHVDDFPSIHSLGIYLNYLDKNDSAYKEYFKWKTDYYLADSMFYCRLCKQLQKPVPNLYNNIQEWHKRDDCNN